MRAFDIGLFTILFSLCALPASSLARNDYPGVAGDGPGAIDNSQCNFEKKIRRLTRSLANEDYSAAIVKRVDALNDLSDLDAYTRFTFCADQDGGASLKFNSPEELLEERIKSLSAFIGWMSGTAGLVVPKGAEKALNNLGKMQEAVDKRNAKATVKQDTFENAYAEYQRLVALRKDSLETLSRLADRALCHGLTRKRLRLARLYHRAIPNNCDTYQAKNLRDTIARDQPPGFSPFLDEKTFVRATRICKPYLQKADLQDTAQADEKPLPVSNQKETSNCATPPTVRQRQQAFEYKISQRLWGAGYRCMTPQEAALEDAKEDRRISNKGASCDKCPTGYSRSTYQGKPVCVKCPEGMRYSNNCCHP